MLNMGLKKYFNFKYIVKGFYSIAEGLSTFNLNPPEKTADEIINKHHKKIQKDYDDIWSDKEAIKKDWEKICNGLGNDLEDLISYK